MMKRSIPVSSSLLLAIGLSSCAPVAFMGAATSVTTSAAEERGIGGVISDAQIKANIQGLWLNVDSNLVAEIDIVVRQGNVLLTGVVDKPQMQIDAVRLAWQAKGVKEVIDETTVGKGGSPATYAKDSWITTQLKSSILFDDDIRSLNYNLQTVNGVVYLMGIAQNKQELDRVIGYARNISGVKKVTSYVQIKQQHTEHPSGETERPYTPSYERDEASSMPSEEPSASQAPIAVEKLDAPNTESSFQ